MTNYCTLAEQTLMLDRYPPEQKNRSLQAWDAADELLVNTALPLLRQAPLSLLLLNDQFGAMACALAAYAPQQSSDSYLSQLATLHNFALNQIDTNQLQQRSSLEPFPSADLVLLKIPNNHSYLRYLLRELKKSISPSSKILASAKAKEINRNVLNIFNEELGPASASLTIKKCRLIEVSIDASLPTPSTPDFPHVWTYQSTKNEGESQPWKIFNHANVFSRLQLDLGARFLLEHLPPLTPGMRVIDLGCGNGILGLSLLKAQAQIALTSCDESYMAVESARLTIANNCPELLQQATFLVDDCLSQQADTSADLIICNPPFHQQHAITDHIAWQMFADARRVLKKQGRLRIVTNNHLGYHEKLGRLFGGCQHIASNDKFTILEAIKRN